MLYVFVEMMLLLPANCGTLIRAWPLFIIKAFVLHMSCREALKWHQFVCPSDFEDICCIQLMFAGSVLGPAGFHGVSASGVGLRNEG